MSIFTFINRKLGRLKTCRICNDKHPCGFGEWPTMFFMCDKCQNKKLEELFEPGRSARNRIAHNLVTQNAEQAEANRRRLEPLIESLTSDRPAYLPQRWNPTHPKNIAAVQEQAAKAAQHRDPRAAQLARAMAQDPRPAASGTQQDRISDPMHILNPLNPLSPISPLNPLNDWDASSHRQYEASSVSSASSCDDDSTRHTSHSSGYESSSSYDSGSDSSSYTSGGCD